MWKDGNKKVSFFLLVPFIVKVKVWRQSSCRFFKLRSLRIWMCKGSIPLPKRMNFRKSSKRPLTPPLIFGKSYCGFFIRLYSLKNHTCGIFLKSPGYESIKNNDPCCQIQCLNFKFWGWLGPRLLVHWGFLTIVNRKQNYRYTLQRLAVEVQY